MCTARSARLPGLIHPDDSASGSPGVRDVDRLRQHDAVRGTAAAVVVGHDVERSAVVTAEHAREAAAVGVDGVQHLAAFGDAGAALSGDAGIPDRPFGVRARSAPTTSPLGVVATSWPSGSQSIENGSPSARVTTSRPPSVSKASTSPATQSHIQNRPSCQRGDSPIWSPVAKISVMPQQTPAEIGPSGTSGLRLVVRCVATSVLVVESVVCARGYEARCHRSR